jgi:hypothetical protein
MRKIKRREKKSKPRKIKRRKTGIRRRNSKFSNRRTKILLKSLELGITQKRSCALAGIGTTTFDRWMEQGKDKSRPVFVAFRKRVKKLHAKQEQEALEAIKLAFKGGNKVNETKVTIKPKGTEIVKVTKEMGPQWQSAAWFLERRFSEDYGRNKTEDTDRTAEEMARDVKAAADMLFTSVPSNKKGSQTDIPEDMPD